MATKQLQNLQIKNICLFIDSALQEFWPQTQENFCLFLKKGKFYSQKPNWWTVLTSFEEHLFLTLAHCYQNITSIFCWSCPVHTQVVSVIEKSHIAFFVRQVYESLWRFSHREERCTKSFRQGACRDVFEGLNSYLFEQKYKNLTDMLEKTH